MVAIDGKKIDIILIGASAGGIKALLNLLPSLPSSWPLSIVVVIHMPEHHESRLVEVFQYHLKWPVYIAQDKQKIVKGAIYLAGPAYHLSIEQDHTFSLSCEDPIHFSRPSIDVLMSSGADAFGSSAIGILLTGANHDGAEGLAHIRAQGGFTIVQDPSEAEIAVMPQAAINYCMPNKILALAGIRDFLLNMEKQ